MGTISVVGVMLWALRRKYDGWAHVPRIEWVMLGAGSGSLVMFLAGGAYGLTKSKGFAVVGGVGAVVTLVCHGIARRVEPDPNDPTIASLTRRRKPVSGPHD
jgi:hypothetical protein